MNNHPITSVHAMRLPKATDTTPAGYLAGPQQTRLAKLQGKRADTFLWGRLLLSYLIDQELDAPWHLEERDNLPPRIVSMSSQEIPSFGISHSGDWLVIALNRQANLQLGIDVEKIRADRKLRTAETFCSQPQLERIYAQPTSQQHSALIKLWTQKEAWFKARQISIFNSDLKGLSIEASETSADLMSTQLGKEYWLSVFSAMPAPAEIYHYTASAACPHIKPLKRQAVAWQKFIGVLPPT